MDRAEWIRLQPFSQPAKVLVAEAEKKKGWRITVQYVQKVRVLARIRQRIDARKASGDETIDVRVKLGRKSYRPDAKWAAYGEEPD